MRVQRYDRGELKPAHITDEGYLFFDGRASRAGVFLYRDGKGGIRRELRPAAEVGNPDSLQTLARKPVTDRHPEEFVDAENADKYAVGILDAEVVWEQDFADGYIRVKGVVQQADAVKTIQDGVQELSAGYEADLDATPGIYTDSNGVEHKYDAVQRNIRYNHLAIVPRGRAGSDARLRLDGMMLDSDESMSVTDNLPDGQPDEQPDTHVETHMKTIKIDGREFSIDEVLAIQRAISEVENQRNDYADELKAAAKDVAESTKKLDEANVALKEAEAVKVELDVLKADAKKREDNKPADVNLIAFANERFELIDLAKRMKLDGFAEAAKVELDNKAIKRAIVMSRFDEDDLPSEAHVDAAFALMKKDSATDPNDKLADDILRSRNDEGIQHNDIEDAYLARMRAANIKHNTKSN